MQNFSDIKNLGTTGKDHLINEMVNSTGLSIERVQKLYENFSIANEGNLEKINESFTDFINPKSQSFIFSEFKEGIIKLANNMINPTNTADNRAQITDQMLRLVENSCGVNVDLTTLLEIICFVLLINDRSNLFAKVSQEIGFGDILSKELNENHKFNFQSIKVDKQNTQKENIINGAENKKLYEGLKDILAKNDKSWGYTYHLDNAYVAIVNYLDKEIEELVNIDNVYTVGENFEMDLLKQLVQSDQLNPMYKSIDVLRKLIPDIQTLVFDSMLLVHDYVSRNSYSIQFLNYKTYTEYLEVTKTLFSAISSSTLSSKIIFDKNSEKTENNEYPMHDDKIYETEFQQIFKNFRIDDKKLDVYNYSIRISSAYELLNIMKACETEFNLRIRKIINLYFTKTYNLLSSTDKVLMEQRKTNRFKNGF